MVKKIKINEIKFHLSLCSFSHKSNYNTNITADVATVLADAC